MTDPTPRTHPTVKQFLYRARMKNNPDWQLELYEGTRYGETGTSRQYLVLCRAGSNGNDPLGRVALDPCCEHVVSFAPVDRLAYGTASALIDLAKGVTA